MLCEKCSANGAENNDFCSACGVSLTPTEPSPKKKPNYKLLGAIACAAIVLAAAIALFFLWTGMGSPQVALEKFVIAQMEGDIVAACKYSVFGDAERFTRALVPASELEEALRYEGYKTLDELFRAFAAEEREWLRDVYGADYTITVRITKERALSQAEMRERIEELEEDYFDYYGVSLSTLFNADRITEMREYNVAIRIAGSEYFDTEYETYLVAKLGAKWLVFIDITELF